MVNALVRMIFSDILQGSKIPVYLLAKTEMQIFNLSLSFKECSFPIALKRGQVLDVLFI